MFFFSIRIFVLVYIYELDLVSFKFINRFRLTNFIFRIENFIK